MALTIAEYFDRLATEAQEIEDLAEDLGLQAVADQLRENREEQERRDND